LIGLDVSYSTRSNHSIALPGITIEEVLCGGNTASASSEADPN